MTEYSRRNFLYTASAVTLASPAYSQEKADSAGDLPVCVFNKPLQHLNYEEQAKLIAEMGFIGVEGTVRTNGHVTPDKATKGLPKQIKALRAHGVDMTLTTTDVNNADDEIHRIVIETTADLGVKQFRMGSIKFTCDRPIPEQLNETTCRLVPVRSTVRRSSRH